MAGRVSRVVKPEVLRWVLLGLLGLVLLVFLVAPWPLLTKLEALSFGIDPQRPAHSHFLGGTRLPLEARKMGIYGGFTVVLGYLWVLGRWRAGRMPPVPVLTTLVGFLGLMAVDGTNAFFYDLGLPHLYAPDNRLRLATGLLTGVTIAGVLWPIFSATFWREPAPVPALRSPGELLGAVLLCVPIYLVSVLGWGQALYPLAVLGALGVVVVVGLLNAVILLVISGREGQGEGLGDLVLPGAGGLLLALAELGALGGLRYALLGQGGFN